MDTPNVGIHLGSPSGLLDLLAWSLQIVRLHALLQAEADERAVIRSPSICRGVTIQVPAAVRLATVGRLPQARCPAGLVNPCRGSPGWSGSAATGWTPRPAARAGRRTGRGAQR